MAIDNCFSPPYMVIKAQRLSGEKKKKKKKEKEHCAFIVHSAVNSTHLLVFL
jgi:hypothetical protein